MFAFEWIALLFFALWIAVAVSRGEAPAALGATVLAAVVAANAATGPDAARGWLGHLYLAAGYWIPAWVATQSPSPRLEAWLAAVDVRCRPITGSLPRWLMWAGDLAYVLCYPLVPMAFVVVWQWGTTGDVNRYWTAVLVAGFVCYGTLPWFVTRPPRLVAGATMAAGTLARGNAWLLSRISHERNTFPSGHVAVSIAAAIVSAEVSPLVGLVCGVVAAGVAVGAVSGRYHYVADVIVGLAVGIACGLIGRSL